MVALRRLMIRKASNKKAAKFALRSQCGKVDPLCGVVLGFRLPDLEGQHNFSRTRSADAAEMSIF